MSKSSLIVHIVFHPDSKDAHESARKIHKGPADVNPLLSAEENRELFHTRDISRMMELILVGLGNLTENR